MYLIVDAKTGQVYHAQPFQPAATPTGQDVVQVSDSATHAQDCLYDPTAYFLASDGSIYRWPYLSASHSGSTLTVSVLTDTATPNGWTAPTSTTVIIGSSSFALSLTNNTASVPLTVHPAVAAMADAPCSVQATGCVSDTINLGKLGGETIGLQVYTPSGGTQTIAPAGPGSKLFLQSYYASQINPAQMPGDLATADSLAIHTLFAVVIPALQKANLLTLDANQQNALNDIATNLIPALPVTLDGAYPNGGTREQPYQQYLTDEEAAAKAFAAYAQDLATIPNLA